MTDVLVVDDAGVLDPVAAELEAFGWSVHRATGAAVALSILEAEPLDGVVAAQRLADLDGVDFLQRVDEVDSGVLRVLVVGNEPADTLNRAHAAGIDHVLSANDGEAETVATRIQSALDAWRLSEQLDRHARHRDAVWQAVREAVAADSREAIETAVCETLASSAVYRVAWVSGYDEQTNTLTPRVAAGIAVSNVKELLLDDIEDASANEVGVHTTGKEGAQQTVTVTLVTDGSLHGVLQLSTPRPPDPAERQDLTALGLVVSAAFEALEASAGPQLEVEEFSSVLSHELRNYLQTAHTHLDLGLADDDTDHFERVRDALEWIGRLADEAEVIATRSIDPADRSERPLEESVAAAWDRLQNPEASVTVVDSTTIEAHQGLLEMLFENLFRNSVEHGADEVRVGTVVFGFYVEDNGPGIPPEHRERVFDWGFTTTDGGSGFGLPVVRLVAETHGWSVDLLEAEDGGARFEITGV